MAHVSTMRNSSPSAIKTAVDFAVDRHSYTRIGGSACITAIRGKSNTTHGHDISRSVIPRQDGLCLAYPHWLLCWFTTSIKRSPLIFEITVYARFLVFAAGASSRNRQKRHDDSLFWSYGEIPKWQESQTAAEQRGEFIAHSKIPLLRNTPHFR